MAFLTFVIAVGAAVLAYLAYRKATPRVGIWIYEIAHEGTGVPVGIRLGLNIYNRTESRFSVVSVRLKCDKNISLGYEDSHMKNGCSFCARPEM